MKMIKYYFVAINIILLLCLTGCVNMPTVHRNQYTFNIPTNQRVAHKDNGQVLDVLQTNISPQFADISFVYRTSGINYTSDYYNTFFYPPSQQINQSIMTYLNNTGLFKYVTSGDVMIKPDYILSSKVLSLYADYRYSTKPKAVITIQFSLVRQRIGQDKIIMNKQFTQIIPIANKDSESLVKAWDRGLNIILRKLTIEMKTKINTR